MYEFELIQSILDGNQQDFKLLIKKYEGNVFRTAIGFLLVEIKNKYCTKLRPAKQKSNKPG